MPTYVYQCKQCGKLEEIFQRMTDSPVMSCPSCGGELERRVSGGTGFIMKGSSLAEGQMAPRCGAPRLAAVGRSAAISLLAAR